MSGQVSVGPILLLSPRHLHYYLTVLTDYLKNNSPMMFLILYKSPFEPSHPLGVYFETPKLVK